MRSPSRRYRVYAWTVTLAGLGVLAYLNQSLRTVDLAPQTNTDLLLWLAMISVAALSPIPLPRGKMTASLLPAVDLAAILLFGPAVACWVAAISRLVMSSAEKWNPLLPGMSRLGQSLLAVAASGIAYAALGGQSGADLTLSREQMLPLAAAAGAYFILRQLLAAAEASLAARTARARDLTLQLKYKVPTDLAMLPMGLLLALTHVRIGAVGVALFLLPLLLARYFFKHWVETRRAYVDTVRTLMSAVDGAEPHTWGHSYRVSKMCLCVGRHLGLPDGDLEEIEFAGLLHDIGRTAIQRDILVKPGRLTAQEQKQLRNHPAVGYAILSDLRFFDGAAEIVRAHHEQPDGKGYPRSLAGDQIPLGSRIIMVVAAFDALTSDRPYRRGLAPEAAFEELLAHAGTQFFPDIVEALIRLYADGRLFDEFDEEHLEQYADGRGHSRAIEAFLERRNETARVPDKKRPTTIVPEQGPAGSGPEIIEFPEPASEQVHEEKTLPLRVKGNWQLMVAAASDLGCRRKNNEDAFGIAEYEDSSRGSLLILADGMGGAAAGEIASRLAVDVVTEAYADRKGRLSARDALERAIQAANAAIHHRAASDPNLAGMGTTCTVASVVGRDLILGHVGDSRAYLVRPSSIEQLTQDHTLAAELASMRTGTGTAPEHGSNVLTRSLGGQEQVQIDVSPRPVRLEGGESILLCSDGLSNVVSADEMLETVQAEEPADACRSLIELARARGGPDNITVLIGKVVQD